MKNLILLMVLSLFSTSALTQVATGGNNFRDPNLFKIQVYIRNLMNAFTPQYNSCSNSKHLKIVDNPVQIYLKLTLAAKENTTNNCFSHEIVKCMRENKELMSGIDELKNPEKRKLIEQGFAEIFGIDKQQSKEVLEFYLSYSEPQRAKKVSSQKGSKTSVH